MHRSGMISIWFFVGILLLAYGVIITATGLYELVSPPERHVVMAEMHAAIWWGIFMLVLGAVYTYRFIPKRQN